METLIDDAALSLASLAQPEVRADPYRLYRRLRTEDPVHWDEPMGFWVLTRYADVMQALHEPRFSKAQGLTTALNRYPEDERQAAALMHRYFSKQLLYADPPYHTQLKVLMNKAFTPRAVNAMRPHIQRIVDELLEAVPAGEQTDLIQQFAYPLPALVILEMLGLPNSECRRFKEWSDDFAATLGVVRRVTPAKMERAGRALGGFAAYIDGFQASHCPLGREDLLTAMFNAEETEGSRLTREELVANAMLLLAAGHETTTNLIGNGLLALLRHPDQLQLLRDDPEKLPEAIEEMMRYDAPVQVVWRLAAEDIELGGKLIRQGQMVNVLLGAANRDPEQFPDPDRFDLGRAGARQLGFSLGTHFCLGAPLARLEGQIAFAALLRRGPALRLASEVLAYNDQPVFRALSALPVVI